MKKINEQLEFIVLIVCCILIVIACIVIVGIFYNMI